MSDSIQASNRWQRIVTLLLFVVIGIAFVGYVVGVNDGVPQEDQQAQQHHLAPTPTTSSDADNEPSAVLPAMHYAEMRRMETGPTGRWQVSLEQLSQPEFDLFAEIHPTLADKQHSTAIRASRRAYNGAPPIVPHAIENTSDSACYTCHGKGLRIGDKVANQMSHGFLANCLQCHSPPPPKPFAEYDGSVENDFTGLPAPLSGQRAFPGAPPTIPHATWMRNNCLACHGHKAGWAGLEVTHPWRTNCQQCHAPSSTLEQSFSTELVDFVSGLEVEEAE